MECSSALAKRIANYLKYSPNTIRQIFYRWITKGIDGLYDAPRAGRKPIWQEEDIKYIENCLEKESRTYNSYQLVEKLKTERSVVLSRDRLRKILKKKIGDGKEPNKVKKENKIKSKKRQKKQT